MTRPLTDLRAQNLEQPARLVDLPALTVEPWSTGASELTYRYQITILEFASMTAPWWIHLQCWEDTS